MLIDQIVNVNISATSATPTIPGTDIPALAGYHNHTPELIKTYFDPSDMLSDGFSSNEALYKMALALAAQGPRPSQFRVIRGTTAVAQVIKFKVTNTAGGQTVGLNLIDAGGTTRPVFHTNSGSQTAAQMATALAAVAVAGATLAVDGSDTAQVNITITATGVVWGWAAAFGGNVTDATPSASLDDDIAAAALVDPSFYGVCPAYFDATNIAEVAAWTEANGRFHAYTTGDTANLTAGTGIFSTLKASAYARSLGLFSGSPGAYGAVAWMAQRFTADAGSDTWAFKTLNGVPVDALTPSQIAAATPLQGGVANNGNVYVPAANVNWTLEGVMASGLYADIRRGIDGLSRDIQLRLAILLGRLPKLPYTRKGIGMAAAEVAASIQSFIPSGFISNDAGFEYQVLPPELASVSPNDKSKRILRNLKFTCTAQGAIQTVFVQGNINF